VLSSNGLVPTFRNSLSIAVFTIPLDYTTTAIDEMAVHPNTRPVAKRFHDERHCMTKEVTTKDSAAEKLKAAGWRIVETSGFLSLVGPLWERVVNGEHEYAILAQDKHHNRRGLVQGGLLMTFADRASGMTARYVSGKPTLATVQMDTHFIDSARIGEILMSKPRVIRATRSLIFTTTEVTAGNRCIATASGVFKILKNET
jgi:acyl-coenzyme A thioesterase PaaI-like protein